MPEPTPKFFPARVEWFTAALITLAIIWMHFHFWENAGGLWRDEVNLVNLANSPSLAAMIQDSFPILMPLLVKLWSNFGATDIWLRLLGLCCGLAIPAAFWAVARATRRPPVFSLVFFGLNSLMICYGDSLRAYGLGTALIVFALAAMCSFLKNPTWSRAGILALAATLSVQALYQNSILFFAICLGAFAVCWQQKNPSAAVKILCAGCVAAISLLPYANNVVGLSRAVNVERSGFSPLAASLNFQTATGFPFDQFTVCWEILAALTVLAAIFSLRRARFNVKTERASLPLNAGVTLAAVVIIFTGFLWFAAVAPPPWYFLPPLALVAACFDFGISPMTLPRLPRVAVFGFVIGIAALSALAANNELRRPFTNVDKLAARVSADASPQDFVVVTPWYCGITFDRYYKSATPWQTLPPLADHTLHRYDLVLGQMLDTNSLAPLLDKISATLRSGHRVWVLADRMRIPAANAFEPPALPPPPLKNSGWSDGPYSASWTARTGFFLSRHSEHFEELQISNAAVSFQENLHLFMAQGWRE
ncbi:MAG TPA: hypothetical protein VIK53_10735 [Verrucomicrobiae bacterium]